MDSSIDSYLQHHQSNCLLSGWEHKRFQRMEGWGEQEMEGWGEQEMEGRRMDSRGILEGAEERNDH